MNRGKAKLNGGKNVEDSGHGIGDTAGKHSLQNRPLQADTAGGLSARHRPKETNSKQLAGHAAQQQPLMTLAGLSPCSAG